MALSDNTADAWQACLFAYLRAVDRGTTDAAGDLLDRLERLGEVLPFLRPFAAAEVAFFEARYRGNLARARELLAVANTGKLESGLRAAAAICLGEAHCADAKQCGEAALKALAEHSTPMDAGTNTAKSEWIHSIMAEADSTGG